MKVTDVHECISFSQYPWMRKYIDMNVELRKNAKSDFEKEMYKLAMNSVYGKQIENIRKRSNVEIILNKPDRVDKVLSSPYYTGKRTIFNENMIAVHQRKKEILLNKPIMGGAAILDLSKYFIYDFWYNVLKAKYNDKIK